MFKNATEVQYDYTRWIKVIFLEYGTNIIHTSLGTMFLVNEDGWAITCKHVVDLIIEVNKLNNNYDNFKKQLALSPNNKNQLEMNFGLTEGKVCRGEFRLGIKSIPNTQLQFFHHPTLDLALINFIPIEPTKYCHFIDDMTKINQGSALARIGFPFVTFNNFVYNSKTDNLSFTQETKPLVTFVIDGIVSQNHNENVNPSIKRTHLILSTPGLKGQSGGPLYDINGLIAGIQSQTKTRDIDFTVPIAYNGMNYVIPQFLNVGVCISSEVIKDFLQKNNVKFYVK